MLRYSAAQMELRILTKQMKLLTNLLRDYLSEVSRETWEHFAAVLHSQSATITELIHGEQGPQRKQNAQKAFANLTETLHDYLVPTRQNAAA